MNLVDVVRKLWNNDGRDRPWGYVMPVTIVTAGNLDDEYGEELAPLPVAIAAGGGAVAKAATATLVNVTASASNVTLRAANTARIGMLVQNDSTAILYLKYGATATTSSYTVKMEPGSYWEMPQPIYTGQVDGIWSAANGAARITVMG